MNPLIGTWNGTNRATTEWMLYLTQPRKAESQGRTPPQEKGLGPRLKTLCTFNKEGLCWSTCAPRDLSRRRVQEHEGALIVFLVERQSSKPFMTTVQEQDRASTCQVSCKCHRAGKFRSIIFCNPWPLEETSVTGESQNSGPSPTSNSI